MGLDVVDEGVFVFPESIEYLLGDDINTSSGVDEEFSDKGAANRAIDESRIYSVL